MDAEETALAALDDAGGRWNIVQAVTAVGYCPGPFTSPPTFRLCVGIPRVTETIFPMQGYTDIQPGQSVTVHYQFTGGGENEHMPLILADMEDDSINTIASAIE